MIVLLQYNILIRYRRKAIVCPRSKSQIVKPSKLDLPASETTDSLLLEHCLMVLYRFHHHLFCADLSMCTAEKAMVSPMSKSQTVRA